MKEVFAIPNDLFGMMVAVDVLVASVWMAVLLWMGANQKRLDGSSRGRHLGNRRTCASESSSSSARTRASRR